MISRQLPEDYEDGDCECLPPDCGADYPQEYWDEYDRLAEQTAWQRAQLLAQEEQDATQEPW